MNKIHRLIIAAPLLLAGCSFFENYNYDDYSLYQYDETRNYGLSYYGPHDYQDDFYKHDGSVFMNHLMMERNFNRY